MSLIHGDPERVGRPRSLRTRLFLPCKMSTLIKGDDQSLTVLSPRARRLVPEFQWFSLQRSSIPRLLARQPMLSLRLNSSGNQGSLCNVCLGRLSIACHQALHKDFSPKKHSFTWLSQTLRSKSHFHRWSFIWVEVMLPSRV